MLSIAFKQGAGIQLTRCITCNSVDFRIMSKRNLMGLRGKKNPVSAGNAVRYCQVLRGSTNEYTGIVINFRMASSY